MAHVESIGRRDGIAATVGRLVPRIPFPLAMVMIAIAIGLATGMDDAKFITVFGKGFGNNLGYFAIILLCSFFLAAAISKGDAFSLGRIGVLLSPFTGAGMVCPDTSYATLAPIAQGYRRSIAVGSYAGFKLMIPAGPLIIGVALSADVGRPGFVLLGLALMVPAFAAGLLWLRLTGRQREDGATDAPATMAAALRSGGDRFALRRLFPLYCLAVLLGVGFLLDLSAHPTIKFLTAPTGTLVVTSVLTYGLVAPERRRECLDSAMRRTASLLLVIGTATALGSVLAATLPLAAFASSFTGVHASIALVVILFGITAVFKMINGSSLATFAAVPPILAPIVSGASLDPTIAVYAICLGSFVAILPNDSFFWLTQPNGGDAAAASAGAGQSKTDFTLTGASVVQGLVGLACLCGYLLVAGKLV